MLLVSPTRLIDLYQLERGHPILASHDYSENVQGMVHEEGNCNISEAFPRFPEHHSRQGVQIFEGLLGLEDIDMISNLVVASGGASLPYSSTQKCGIQFKGTECS